MEKGRIIAAVRDAKQLELATKTDVDVIFMLAPNIAELKSHVDTVHAAGKKIFIHLDLAEGIGKDEYGIRFVKEQGADGIISTRANIIKLARKVGIRTVQRFFIVDSQSVQTTVETAASSKADMIEVMPGTVSKVIRLLKNKLDMPIVAGGLLETAGEIEEAIACGARAVSTGKKELWS